LRGYPYLRTVPGWAGAARQRNPKGVAVQPRQSGVYVDERARLSVWISRPSRSARWPKSAVSRNPLGENLGSASGCPHGGQPEMSARKWISCASCHPGATRDGRNLQNPRGSGTKTALFGMSRTLPLHGWPIATSFCSRRLRAHDGVVVRVWPLMQGKAWWTATHRGAGRPLAVDPTPSMRLAAIMREPGALAEPHALGPGRLSRRRAGRELVRGGAHAMLHMPITDTT